MRRRAVRTAIALTAACLAALALAAAPQASPSSKPEAKPQAPAAKPQAPAAKPQAPAKPSPLDRFKALAGTWDVQHDGAEGGTIIYKVVSNGNTVMESMFPGTDHEMVTMYFMDGDKLMLTHYCALGNQPRLKASQITDNTVAFEFQDATNLPSRNEMHMGAVTFTFKDPDHVHATWTAFNEGKEAHKADFEMTRHKS